MNRQRRFRHFRSVTVFGWSESHPGDAVYEAARETACLLARHGLTVVSGGFGGEMEAAARGAKEGGGKTIGVTFYPALATKFEAGKGASSYLDQEIKAKTYLERIMTHAGEPVLPGSFAFLGDGWVELGVDHTVAGNPMRFHQGRLDLAPRKRRSTAS